MYMRDTKSGRIVFVCGKPRKDVEQVLVIFGQKDAKPRIWGEGTQYAAYLIDEDRLEALPKKKGDAKKNPNPHETRRLDDED